MTKKESDHLYYLQNRGKILAANKAYYQRYKEQLRQNTQRRMRDWMQTPKGIYHVMKGNSRKKNRDFALDQKEFLDWYELVPKICFYCDLPQNGKRLSIDRADNNVGYEISNLRLACSDCNTVKGSVLTEKEMLQVGKSVMKQRWQS